MVMQPTPEDEIENDFSGSYHKKEEVKSYRQIVLEAIEKCRIEGSKQMKKGGSYIMDDGTLVSSDDQREVYISSIETLFDLIYFFFDEDAKEKIEGLHRIKVEGVDVDKLGVISKNIYGLTQKYFNKYLEKEWWKPYKDQASKEQRMVEGNKSNSASFWTQQKEDERVALYRQVFIELNLLFKRKNELSGKKVLSAFD